MEDTESSVPLFPLDGETEFSPTGELENAVDVAVTAVNRYENTAVNGGGAGAGDGRVEGLADANGVAVPDSTVRRKRGRPRKNPAALPISQEFSASPDHAAKRGRGRPRGSGKLQVLASLGGLAVDTAGSNFTPHAMTIQTGEDIGQKILSFSQRGSVSICILSATGAVSSVDIRQPGSFGGILRYEGRFEILALSGSHALNDMGGVRHKVGLLSVSLANPDGRVFGGAVAGSLIAAGPIQLIVASFKPNMKKRLKMRHAAESSITTGILCNSDAATVQTPDGKTTDTEDCLKPTSLFPEPLFEGAGDAISGENVNHASFRSIDWNVSQLLQHVSDHSTSDIDTGMPET